MLVRAIKCLQPNIFVHGKSQGLSRKMESVRLVYVNVLKSVVITVCINTTGHIYFYFGQLLTFAEMRKQNGYIKMINRQGHPGVSVG